MTCSDKQKVTIMVLKVDLQCCQCYKKVKKVLCKFPQIRDQVFDEKLNTVTITVVCCSPERIRDKLSCKGGKSIESIEIKPPKKPEAPAPQPPPPKKPEAPAPQLTPPKKPEAPAPRPTPPCPPQQVFQVAVCCGPCYEGRPGGPCYQSCGGPQYGYGYGRPPCPPGYYVSRCDCFSEENPSSCSIM